jgi:NAD(P)-dependent dehydrogenase (short-subunit alcohol dehydrogenase family)
MAQTVVITGTGRGIGREMARQAAARGDRVIGTQRHGDAPAGVEVRPLDVTDAAGVTAFAAGLGSTPVDLLVCNAGVYLGRGRIHETEFPPEAWAQTFAVNVTGVFLMIEALLPALERSGRGRIAVISSQMGSSTRAKGANYIYRASKAAATNLAVNLALDLKPRGIAIGAWHPGWVRTDMGGSDADIDTAESASGLLARFEALSLETTGCFEMWNGDPIPF